VKSSVLPYLKLFKPLFFFSDYRIKRPNATNTDREIREEMSKIFIFCVVRSVCPCDSEASGGMICVLDLGGAYVVNRVSWVVWGVPAGEDSAVCNQAANGSSQEW